MSSEEIAQVQAARLRSLKRCLPGHITSRIASSKVLLVGAGGIGCELLKNLVLSGFSEVHMLDLDTIDLSNLNRQFLFRKQHIKKSKALTARDAAGEFNPNVRLIAYHADIKDPEFGVQWFRGFDLVFNALDNVDARRHVNRMCLMADVPLIESGTTGYRGQVQVIVSGQTECYDCNPKEVPKSFPICTIRSTPSQPIHCIVWAKSYLFSQVFGIDEDEPVLDASSDADNAVELDNLRREASALKLIRDSMGTLDFPRLVFDKVFREDIDRLRAIEDMWKHRPRPKSLSYEVMKSLCDEEPASSGFVWLDDQRLWSLQENFRVFEDSLNRLSRRLLDKQQDCKANDVLAALDFDKDDNDALDFVAATANLRAGIFDIEQKTKFQVKQMAGNIIAAIATTNAIVAAVCVLQALQLMRSGARKTKTVFLSRRPERIFNNELSAMPRAGCEVCGVARAVWRCDPKRVRLSNLIDDILRAQLGYGEELSVLTSSLIYDPDFDDNVEMTLEELGIRNGSLITCLDDEEDESGNSRINLVLLIEALPEGAETNFYPADIARADIARGTRSPEIRCASSRDDAVAESKMLNLTPIAGKRRRPEEDMASVESTKRAKTGSEDVTASQELLIVEEQDGAAVVID
ncbi:E1 ubiquitin-activating protein uba2 [Savitreella phatthalungensis]